ncbi:MAG: hypothetical protein PWP51_515 [Clostridiales bacterium]|jgi:hypothetical protein|nr:hypothetical protein [Clostridiales bacterium]MDN5297962.1 hypothetical protein [Clostridiales bacterium]
MRFAPLKIIAITFIGNLLLKLFALGFDLYTQFTNTPAPFKYITSAIILFVYTQQY